jgi:hypothetical protein
MPIRWVKTPAGKMMPLDEKPVLDGNLVVIDGVATAGGDQESILYGDGFRYVSHFATCAQAAQHRRKA